MPSLQCEIAQCADYSDRGVCTCSGCEDGWKLLEGGCLMEWQPQPKGGAFVDATSPDFVNVALAVPMGGKLTVSNYLLEGDTEPSTLVLERFAVWMPDATVIVAGTPRAPPDTRCECALLLLLLPAGLGVRLAADALAVPARPGCSYFRGTLQGNEFHVATLFVRSDGGVGGMGLRSETMWMLGKPTDAELLTSKKATAADWDVLPDFTEVDMQPGPAPAAPAAAAAAAAAAAVNAQASTLLPIGGCCLLTQGFRQRRQYSS